MAIGEIIGKAGNGDFRGGDFRAAIKQHEINRGKKTKRERKGERKKKDHVEEELISAVIFQTQRKRSARMVPKINLVCNGVVGGENPIFRMYALGKGMNSIKTQGRL